MEVLRYAPGRPAQTYRGLGISLHPLDPKHMDSLRELNMRYVRVGAGPGWGGMMDPDFPDDPALMEKFIAAYFNRDDPERLADFKESFAFFKQHDIRVVLVQYQIPYRWLKKDFMRTLKPDNVERIVAQWTALLKFFRKEGMGVDFVELANEPDGNWDGHIPPALYYRLVPRARQAFDHAGFKDVQLLGPGLSSLDLEHRPEAWINGMTPAVHRALGGFSLHGWDEVLATDARPVYLARSWDHPRAAFRRLDPEKPIYLTEYATEITKFGGRTLASPRSGAFYTAAETPHYALRVLANTLVHLDRGVSVPMLWRLSDNDADATAWGMIRGPRRGGAKRPLFFATKFLAARLPIPARVIPTQRSDADTNDDPLSAVLLKGQNDTVWAGVNVAAEPRRVQLQWNGISNQDVSGEVLGLDGKIDPLLSISNQTNDSIAFTLPAESAVVLRLREVAP